MQFKFFRDDIMHFLHLKKEDSMGIYRLGLQKFKDNFNLMLAEIESANKRIEYFEKREKEGIYIKLSDIEKCKELENFKNLVQGERIKQGAQK